MIGGGNFWEINNFGGYQLLEMGAKILSPQVYPHVFLHYPGQSSKGEYLFEYNFAVIKIKIIVLVSHIPKNSHK